MKPVATTPKKEPVMKVKTPKIEDVKPEMIKKVEGHLANAAVKSEKTESKNVSTVKKQDVVKVNVGCGGGACN